MIFGGIPKNYSGYNKSEIVILPVPFDSTSTWIKGADKGPDAIIEASENMEMYDIDTDTQVFKKGIHVLPKIEAVKSVNEMVENTELAIKKCIKDKKFPVIIGGNHSVSIGSFKAFSESFKDLTIVQLDAHADLRDSYEGSAYNHACVMARAKENASIIQVGVRSMSEEEKYHYEDSRIFFAEKVVGKRDWHKKVHKQLTKNVYLTIDLDVFDPSVVPATGTPEPGGLNYYDVLNFVKYLTDHSNLVGFDIVELCPMSDNKMSDFLAAKLLYQILSYRFK